MSGQGLLGTVAVLLAAGVVSVPLAKRLGLGSVLGYLVAGALIGPFGLKLLNNSVEVMHVAEFGVVMLLFLVGLELNRNRSANSLRARTLPVLCWSRFFFRSVVSGFSDHSYPRTDSSLGT